MKRVLSQSAHGRAIDATDMISGNSNYVDLGAGLMEVRLHKPTVAVERVELLLSNPGQNKINIEILYNGDTMPLQLERREARQVSFTVNGFDVNQMVAIIKEMGDELFVMGGAET